MRNKRKNITLHSQIEKQLRYGIRKFKGYGAASVAIASTLVFLGNHVQATESTTPKSFTVIPSTPEEIEATKQLEKPLLDMPTPLTEGVMLRSSNDAVEAPVITFMKDGQVFNHLSEVLRGENGSFSINVQIKFSQNSTNKKVKIELGRFLDVAGNPNEVVTVKPQLKEGTKVVVKETDPMKSLTGESYFHGFSGAELMWYHKKTLEYEFKDSTSIITIPIEANFVKVVSQNGIAEDGEVDGNRDGIEKDIPIKVTATSTRDTQADETIQKVPKLSNGQNNKPIQMINRDGNPNQVRDINKKAATTSNGFNAHVALRLGSNFEPGFLGNIIKEKIGVNVTLPKGVAFNGFVENTAQLWKVKQETPTGDGGKVLEIESTKPQIKESQLFLDVTVDTNIQQGEEVKIQVGESTYKIRNFENEFKGTPFTYYLPIIKLSDQDNISFFNDARVGAPHHKILASVGNVLDKNVYQLLGTFGRALSRNFDNRPSRPKELHYEFPKNEYVKVKGITLPNLVWKNVDQILIKTEQVPVLTPKSLPIPLEANKLTSVWKQKQLKLTDLGYNADDVLTEVIVPIGQIPANGSMDDWRIYAPGTDIFGQIVKTSETIEKIGAVTLRDENFESSDPQRNWKTGTLEFSMISKLEYGRDDIIVNMLDKKSKFLNHGESHVLKYNIGSELNYTPNATYPSEVDKLVVVLPKALKVKNINISQIFNPSSLLKVQEINLLKKSITGETVSHQELDDNIVYTIDVSNVSDKANLVGWYGTEDKKVGAYGLLLEVEVENATTSNQVDVPLNQNVFAVLKEARSAKKIGSYSLKADPFKLAALLGTDVDNIFTNVSTPEKLVLLKADKLDVSSNAKLNTQAEFSEIGGEFNINNVKDDLQVKLSLSNPTINEIENIDMFIPIPKKGQNWGANFHQEAFGFDLNLKKIQKNPNFDQFFDITYAQVEPNKLNGKQFTADELSNERFTENILGANLMRIKSKTNTPFAGDTLTDITLDFGLADINESEDDGKSITWNPLYKVVYENGTRETVEKGRNLTINVSLGKLGVQYFEDTNANGIKDMGEKYISDPSAHGLTFELLGKDSGKKIILKDQVEDRPEGGKVIKGVTTGTKYRLISTVTNDKRFTTPEKTDNAKRNEKEIQAQATSVEATQLTQVGVTIRIVLQELENKILVNNPANLSVEELKKVEEAFKQKNPLPDGTIVTVNANGSISVRYLDGFTEAVSEDKLIRAKEKSGTPSVNEIKSSQTQLSGTGQTGAKIHLSLPGGSKVDNITVEGGNWSYTLPTPLPKGAKIIVTQLEDDKLESDPVTTTVLAKDSESYQFVAPTAPIEVVNPDSLEQGERDQVKQAVQTANQDKVQHATNIEVDEKGKVTITYTDGSTQIIEPAQTVAKQGQIGAPSIHKVDSDDLTLSGTGVEGATVTVHFPDGRPDQTVQVQPGGQWQIQLTKPLAKDLIVQAKQSKLGKSESEWTNLAVSPTLSDQTNIVNPVPTFVEDIRSLTNPEKEAVKKAIADVNASLPEHTIEVENNGKVVITFTTDQSKTEILPIYTVKQKETTNVPIVNPIDVDDTKVTGYGVKNAVIKVLIAGNPTPYTAKVNALGMWSVDIGSAKPLNTQITVTQTEPNKKSSENVVTTVGKNQAGKYDLIKPNQPIAVDNPTQLTKDEKDAIEKAIRDINPDLPQHTTIAISDSGEVVATYLDGSQDTLLATDVLVQKPSAATPVIQPIRSDATEIIGTGPADGTVELTFGDVKVTVPISSDGQWKYELAKPLATGTEVQAVAKKEGLKDAVATPIRVTPTEAEIADLQQPDTKVLVDNPNDLSLDEIQSIKNAIKAKNPKASLDDSKIQVEPNGKTIVTFTDGSTKVFEPGVLVEGKTDSVVPNVDPIHNQSQQITGKGKKGATVQVNIPGVGTRQVTIPKTALEADGEVPWAIDIPAGTSLKTNQTILVIQTEENKKVSAEVSVEVQASQADSITRPDFPVKVNNPAKLSVEEIATIKQLIKDKVQGLEENAIVVDQDGKVTITFPDGSKKVFEGTEVVVQKDQSGVFQVMPVDSDDVQIKGTGQPSAKVKVYVEGSPDSPIALDIEVSPEGQWSATIPAQAADTRLIVEYTEVGKLATTKTITVGKTLSQQQTITTDGIQKVKVDNPAQLSDTEKIAVEKEIRRLNPTLGDNGKVEVALDGTVTIKYSDGTSTTIEKDKVVEQKEASIEPTVDDMDSDDMEIKGTAPAGSKVEITLPGGGVVIIPVPDSGKWSHPLSTPLASGSQVNVRVLENGKRPSATITKDVAKTAAETANLQTPTEKVKVNNPNDLSTEEMGKVKEAIKNANTGANLEDGNIEVDPNGRTTVKFPDGSTKVFEPGVVIEGKTDSVPPTVDAIHNQKTTITGKGKKGATITVVIPGVTSPKTYNIPTDAPETDGEVPWSIDLPAGTLKPNQSITITQTEDGKRESTAVTKEVQASQADSMEKPLFPVKVNDANKLSDTEIATIKQLIKDKVPSLGEDAIVVNQDGKVTITFPDGSKKVFEGKDVVLQKEVSGSFTVNPVDSNDTTISGTGLSGAKVKIYVKDPYELLIEDITVTPNGTWTADISAKTTDTQLEIVYEEQDKLPNIKIITVQPTLAEKQILVTDGFTKVKVDDANALTDTEKLAVENEVRRLNTDLPEHTKVEVALDGTVTIKYPDGTSSTIDKGKVVEQKEASTEPTVNDMDSDDKEIKGTAPAGSKVEITLPGGGVVIIPVPDSGKWSHPLSTPLASGSQVNVRVLEDGKRPSATITKDVAKTAAETANLQNPTEKVKVNNPNDLSTEEMGKVKEAIKNANTGANLEDGNIDVKPNGTTIVTFPDGSTKVFEPAEVIVGKDQIEAPTVNPVHTQSTKISGTGVAGATITIELPYDKTITAIVGQNGNWESEAFTPIVKDYVIKVTQSKEGFKPSLVVKSTVQAPQADSVDETALTFKHENPGTYDFMPGTVYVVDPSALTNEEKVKVSEKVKEKVLELMEGLPQNQKDALRVDVQGEDVIITYEDQSIDKIKVSKVVTKIQQSPVVVEVPTVYDFMTTLRGKGIPGSTVTITILPPATAGVSSFFSPALATQAMPISKTTRVKSDGTWEIEIGRQPERTEIFITQQIMYGDIDHPGWTLSEQVEIFVKKLVPLPPQDPNQGEQDQPQTPEKPGSEDVIIVPIDPNSNVLIRPLHPKPGTIIVPNGQKPGVQETKPTSELTDPTKQKDGKGTLPNTGEVSTAWSVVAAAGMTLAGAITLFKKKKEDE